MYSRLSSVPLTLTRRCQVRPLSSQGESAIRKLQSIMQDYRLENYAQELPLRFKKEVVAAAANSENVIVLSTMEKVLNNIGAAQKITSDELRIIFQEVGKEGAIPAEKMVQLL